jgi:hypothetical protein
MRIIEGQRKLSCATQNDWDRQKIPTDVDMIALISCPSSIEADQGPGFTGQNGESKPFWVGIADPAHKITDIRQISQPPHIAIILMGMMVIIHLIRLEND